jgi:flavin-dependent dehydrogenase
MSEAFDVLIIGSGFGGSVSALRLAEKGYRVAVLVSPCAICCGRRLWACAARWRRRFTVMLAWFTALEWAVAA